VHCEPKPVAPALAAGSPEGEELFCLHCGYNLRGLPGDPLRCPECGSEFPREELRLPSGLIEKQLLRLDAAPSIVLLALIAALPASLIAFSNSRLPEFAYLPIEVRVSQWLACAAPVLGLPIAVWWFRRTCLAGSGWLVALAAYVAWLLLLLAMLAVPIALVQLYAPRSGGRSGIKMWAVATAVALIAFLLVTGVAQWMHRCACEPVRRLQRAVALAMARRYLQTRSRVRSGERW
jgi:hypothetical protein